jgi:hypothetical protein
MNIQTQCEIIAVSGTNFLLSHYNYFQFLHMTRSVIFRPVSPRLLSLSQYIVAKTNEGITLKINNFKLLI